MQTSDAQHLLAEINSRQDGVLAELDALQQRIDALLASLVPDAGSRLPAPAAGAEAKPALDEWTTAQRHPTRVTNSGDEP